MTALSGWGRWPRHESELVVPRNARRLTELQTSARGIVARGNGRAYGDAAVGERITLSTQGLDRFRSFDPETGRLTVEAGVLLSDVIDVFLPQGFFPPVVPGTKFVTIGGMIAADVHGKNHHRSGAFGDHVERLSLALPDGRVVECGRGHEPGLFAATFGGMGLTGTILDATFRLMPVETGWLRRRVIVADDLEDAMDALAGAAGATYSVAWIDCLAKGEALGRSLVQAADHAGEHELGERERAAGLFPAAPRGRLAVPFELPTGVINRASVAAFNELYFRKGAADAETPRLVPWDPFFFPLDGIGHWNRIYGRRGFLQHQCVVPTRTARAALADILERISARGRPSFLAVLKQFGPGRRSLSFPLEGFTLALDLPVDEGVDALLAEIDTVVARAGGRLYLAKDSRQSRDTFEAGYPDLPAFRELRRAIDPDGRIASRLSGRLGL